MGKPRRDVQTLDAEPPQVFDEAADDEPLDQGTERFLIERAEGVSDAVVKVYRAATQASPGKAAQARDAWLYQCPPDEFHEEYLQANYGAGSYRIKMYGTQRGQFSLMVNRIIEIGPLPKEKAAALAVQPVGAASSGAADIARAIAEANAPLVAGMMALIQKMGDGGSSRKALLEEMQMMSAIVKPQNSGNDVNSLMLALTLAEKVSGMKGGAEIDSESGPWLVLREVAAQLGGPVSKLIEASMTKHGAKPALAAPPGNAEETIAGAQAGADQISEEERKAVGLALKMQLGVLLAAAQGNGDPGMYGQLIYEQAPDAIIDQLQAPNWFENLCAIEPAFSKHKDWCEKARAVVVQLLAEDSGEETLPGAGNDTVAGASQKADTK